MFTGAKLGLDRECLMGLDRGCLREKRGFKAGKTGIAKGYLGLQGTRHDKGAMDESKESLPCGEDMESDFKRFGIESVNATFESLKGRVAQGTEGIEKHGFL